jgi:integrase
VRRGELCGLRWSDIDLAAGTLWVRRAVKYGTRRMPIEGPTKTHQIRRVALDRGTVVVLSDYRDRQLQWAADAGVEIGVDAYVFTLDPSGQKPWLPDSFSHSFERVARKVNAGLRLHDLRHFAATHAIAAGIDVRTVAGRLGHADASTTLRVYSQFVVERDRQAAEVVGSLISDA